MGHSTTHSHDAQRAAAAYDDVVAVEDVAPGMVRVVTWSDAYVVDARDGGCTCPDKQYRDVARCKHEYAALASDTSLPDAGMTVDDLSSRQPVATDGGEPDRPHDCECWDVDESLPCWPCYREGYRSQNPAEPAADDADADAIDNESDMDGDAPPTMADKLDAQAEVFSR